MNSERAGWCARFADAWLPTAVWSRGRRTSDLWGDASCSLAQQTTSSVLWHVEEHKHGVNNYTHLLIIKGFRVALGSKFVFFSAVLTVTNWCDVWHINGVTNDTCGPVLKGTCAGAVDFETKNIAVYHQLIVLIDWLTLIYTNISWSLGLSLSESQQYNANAVHTWRAEIK